MSAKRFLSGLFILLCFVNVSLGAQIVFSENFETGFALGVLPEKGESSTARFQVRDKTSSMSIVRVPQFPVFF